MGRPASCGFDVTGESERVRESISLTGQFAAVDGILTGRENLVLVAQLRAVANPTQVADSLLSRFGLTTRPGTVGQTRIPVAWPAGSTSR